MENDSEKSLEAMEADDPNKTRLARGVELVLLVPSVWRRRSAMRARNSRSMGFLCSARFRVSLMPDFEALAIVLDDIGSTILPASTRKLEDYTMDRTKELNCEVYSGPWNADAI